MLPTRLQTRRTKKGDQNTLDEPKYKNKKMIEIWQEQIDR